MRLFVIVPLSGLIVGRFHFPPRQWPKVPDAAKTGLDGKQQVAA